MNSISAIVQDPLACEFPDGLSEKAGLAYCLLHGTSEVSDDYLHLCAHNATGTEPIKLDYFLRLPKTCLVSAILMTIAVKLCELFSYTGALNGLKSKDIFIKDFYNLTYTFKTICLKYLFALCIIWTVTLCIFWMFDAVIHKSYLTYGYQVIHFNTFGTSNIDPVCQLFPLTGSCDVKYFDISGSQQSVSPLCTINVNLANQTFYFGLWFYFWSLILIIPASLFVWFSLALRPKARAGYLGLMLQPHEEYYLKFICHKYDIYQYFVLCHSLKHFDFEDKRDIIHALYTHECGQP